MQIDELRKYHDALLVKGVVVAFIVVLILFVTVL